MIKTKVITFKDSVDFQTQMEELTTFTIISVMPYKYSNIEMGETQILKAVVVIYK